MRHLTVILFACACASSSSNTAADRQHQTSAVSSAGSAGATATLEPRSGSSVSGTATFQQVADGVAAHVEVRGAQPGQHGVHVHEKGDCNDPKAQSAGPHFNPNTGAHHGGPQTQVRHGGDLGNLNVDSSGNGTVDVTVRDLSLAGPNGVVGRSVVVHEKADDLQSDPAGNSGGRFACGVIQASAAR
jgi:Cu-Zn family superoxide dismutase